MEKKGRDELWEKGRASEGWKKERKEGFLSSSVYLPEVVHRHLSLL